MEAPTYCHNSHAKLSIAFCQECQMFVCEQCLYSSHNEHPNKEYLGAVFNTRLKEYREIYQQAQTEMLLKERQIKDLTRDAIKNLIIKQVDTSFERIIKQLKFYKQKIIDDVFTSPYYATFTEWQSKYEEQFQGLNAFIPIIENIINQIQKSLQTKQYVQNYSVVNQGYKNQLFQKYSSLTQFSLKDLQQKVKTIQVIFDPEKLNLEQAIQVPFLEGKENPPNFEQQFLIIDEEEKASPKKNIKKRIILEDLASKTMDQIILEKIRQRDFHTALTMAINELNNELIFKIFSIMRREADEKYGGIYEEFVKEIYPIPGALDFLIKYAQGQRDIYYNNILLETIFRFSHKVREKYPELVKFIPRNLEKLEDFSQIKAIIFNNDFEMKKSKIQETISTNKNIFIKDSLEEYLKIVNESKKKKMKDITRRFLNCNSIIHAIETLTRMGYFSIIKSYLKEFNLSEKVIWALRLKVYTSGGEWHKVEALVKEKKKPPIPWNLFAEEAIMNNRVDLAVPYIRNIKDIGQKVDLFLEIGLWKEALDEAILKKRSDLFGVIEKETPFNISEYIQKAHQQILPKKKN